MPAGGWQWWTNSAVGWHTRDEEHGIKFDKYGRRKFQIQVVSRERNAVNMLQNLLAFNTFIRWPEKWEGGRIWCMCCGLWELCPHHMSYFWRYPMSLDAIGLMKKRYHTREKVKSWINICFLSSSVYAVLTILSQRYPLNDAAYVSIDLI
jgi:hypothetical protein